MFGFNLCLTSFPQPFLCVHVFALLFTFPKDSDFCPDNGHCDYVQVVLYYWVRAIQIVVLSILSNVPMCTNRVHGCELTIVKCISVSTIWGHLQYTWCSLTHLSPISSLLTFAEGGEFIFCSFQSLVCIC